MKTDNKWVYKVAMYLFLFLCILIIGINFTIYGEQTMQDVQESLASSANNECNYSGEGNDNSFIHKIINTISNHVNANSKSNLFIYVTSIFSIVLWIKISEVYFYKQSYIHTSYRKTLIAQKVRLNN